jgi:hypothetical protein
MAEAKPPDPVAAEAETTSSKRGPGPDDQPNKKVTQESKTLAGSRTRKKSEE